MHRNQLFTLAAFCLFAAAPVRTQQGSVADLTAQLLPELKGGGWRDSLVWQASDSTSFGVMQKIRWPNGDRIRTQSAYPLECPGGTDATGRAIARPVGYILQIATDTAPGESLLLNLEVRCQFTFRGRPHAFLQTQTWLLARAKQAWKVGRLVNGGIT